MTDLRHAFETPEGRATADDVAKLAPKDKVRTMVYELEDALQSSAVTRSHQSLARMRKLLI